MGSVYKLSDLPECLREDDKIIIRGMRFKVQNSSYGYFTDNFGACFPGYSKTRAVMIEVNGYYDDGATPYCRTLLDLTKFLKEISKYVEGEKKIEKQKYEITSSVIF